MSKGQLLLFVCVACVCASFVFQGAQGTPARVVAYNSLGRDVKIPRTIRAPFRNREMMTARGFGKRSQSIKYKEVGGGSPWLMAEKTDPLDGFPLDLDPVEQMVNESRLESFPIDWLVDELMTSPVLTRAVLQRFVDRNHDGSVSAQELLGGHSAPSSSADLQERSGNF